jgi:death-on-curing protein
MMFEWLDVDDVIEIHQKQLARYGGPAGIRDQNLLESAVARPQQKYHYRNVTEVRELAAAYAFGIARNHPFTDGNKRAAYFAMRTFLILNGLDIEASEDEKYDRMIALASGQPSEDQLADWLRTVVQSIS